ncbi:MAG: carbohydrate ABC transporter permease [Clostridiales bacterium]|nr:carbohydrate ABC transporter permease [Clostridiales bacterium]
MKLHSDDRRWLTASHIVLIFCCALVLIPFFLLIVASFTDNNWATVNGFSFFPKEWSVVAYTYISTQWATIGRGYLMTVIVTAAGTFGSIMLTSMYAYGLSIDTLPGTKILNFLTVFTMLFSGGIVASYFCWSNIFHVRDTIWALILPNLMMSAFNVILVKNYYKFSLPAELLEAARIDGASEFGVFWKIVFPLSVPIIVTIGLMTGLLYWNDWTNGLYYLTERGGSHLYTVQILLNQINDNITFLSQNASSTGNVNVAELPSTTVRMAIAIVGVLPVMIVYPFFQRFFVKGITLGGVKG